MAAVDGSAPVFAPPDGQAAGEQRRCLRTRSACRLAPILPRRREHPGEAFERGPKSSAIARGVPARSTARSISAPTTAACSWRGRRGAAFSSSTPSPGSSSSAKASAAPACLSEEAMARTIDALRMCSAKMARRGVTRSRLVATEACRIAKNGGDFIARVERETGLSLEIIGRETEARLAVSGCASLIDKQSDYVLIFDIGGGSSEFVWLNLAKERPSRRVSIEDRLRAQDSIEAWTSLPFGVVTLAERFGKSFVEGHQFEEMVTFVQAELKPFSDRNNIAAKIAAARRAPARHIRNRHHHCRRVSRPFGISSRQGRRLLALVPKASATCPSASPA